jgi:hypothetical protein
MMRSFILSALFAAALPGAALAQSAEDLRNAANTTGSVLV